jgi:hypothetical protein
MTSAPFAHIGGVPIEETLGSLGPALLIVFGVAWTQLRARLRAVRSRASGPGETPARKRTKAGPLARDPASHPAR